MTTLYMMNLVKDFYVMAFQFARRLDAKRGMEGAAEYARNMCALWLVFSIWLATELAILPFGLQFRNLLGRTRFSSDVVAIIALVLSTIVVSYLIRRIADLQSPEDIKCRYNRLSRRRILFVLGLVIGTPIAFLLLCFYA